MATGLKKQAKTLRAGFKRYKNKTIPDVPIYTSPKGLEYYISGRDNRNTTIVYIDSGEIKIISNANFNI